MIEFLKKLWNTLTGKESEPKQPIEVTPPVMDTPKPDVQPPVNTTDNWPFPTASRPEDVVKKQVPERKKRTVTKTAAPVPVMTTRKTAKEIAAERRKEAAQKDQARAKGKKTK